MSSRTVLQPDAPDAGKLIALSRRTIYSPLDYVRAAGPRRRSYFHPWRWLTIEALELAADLAACTGYGVSWAAGMVAGMADLREWGEIEDVA